MKTRQASKVPKSAAKPPPRQLPEAFYRIDALLRTMRCIAQHEDRFCTLLHTVKQARAVEPDVLEELQTLLGELPAHEYADDLAAVYTSLAAPAAKPKKKAAKKIMRKNPART